MLGRTAGYEISFFPAGKNKCNLKIRQNAALAEPSSLQGQFFQHFYILSGMNGMDYWSSFQVN
jgi:hypothetical protein